MIFNNAIAALASLALGLVALPAQANETATAAQITGAVAADAGGARGDAEFQELFASWKAIESARPAVQASGIIAAPVARVAVPSRMPVDGVRLSSDYGMRSHPVLGGRRAHNGVDLAGASGTPVYATADGLVARADYYGSYGNYIQIEHGGELQTRYAHLSGFAVGAGQRVVKGQLIGYVGSTGRSTGPHLHYEVRVAGRPVDPRPYMVAQLAAGEGGVGGPE
ncbi:MAG: M23 family metallopeptidase [Porphyrobacter sp.]|nr:M23 family metallopeptidase [Porphyrobacter sp.]